MPDGKQKTKQVFERGPVGQKSLVPRRDANLLFGRGVERHCSDEDERDDTSLFEDGDPKPLYF
jgi:hypothetical protein